MAYIKPITNEARWVIPTHNVDGITTVGEATGTNNALDAGLIWAEGEAEFLEACQDEIGDYNPIPNVGEWCEAGTLYGYNDGAVICRQSHYRMAYTPEETPALWLFYNPEQPGEISDWIVGEQVNVGNLRKYNGTDYQCLQAHVTQVDWTPPQVLGILWVEYNPEPPVGEWSYPTAYAVGAIVTYLSITYRCLQAHTSNVAWTPLATLGVLWATI